MIPKCIINLPAKFHLLSLSLSKQSLLLFALVIRAFHTCSFVTHCFNKYFSKLRLPPHYFTIQHFSFPSQLAFTARLITTSLNSQILIFLNSCTQTQSFTTFYHSLQPSMTTPLPRLITFIPDHLFHSKQTITFQIGFTQNKYII